MSFDRREFFERAAAAAAGLRATGLGVEAQQRGSMPTPQARGLMNVFGLRVPIFCSGMGLAAAPDLAVAVSNAGGLGSLGTGGEPPADQMRTRVEQTRAGTTGPFSVNYILHNRPISLQAVLDAGAPVIHFAFGLPSADMIRAIRRAGARMGVQVSGADGARRALDLSADYLVCQGTEAGGHVQALSPLSRTLPAVIAEAKTIPVLAAGGLATGTDIRRALEAGAAGAFMGTRFLATKESDAHPEHKAALLRANGDDTALTICFQDGWLYPHRVVRNRTVDMWEADGCPPPGRRPGENDITGTYGPFPPYLSETRQRRRYSASMPRPGERGQIAEQPLYAGVGVGSVRDLPSAGDLVARLWKECLG